MAKDQATNLGDRVRKRRKALGLTAKSLAKASGVSTSYISQVERGHQRDPSLPALRRLADALSMDLHVLLGAENAMAEPISIPTSLREFADEYRIPTDTVRMLAGIHIDGRQPSSREDWLFLLLAVRRSCHILEPLAAHGAVGEKGEKHALRS